MNHFNIFDDKIVYKFDFKNEYIGYVIDNNDFESELLIKVFIPELFGYNYKPSMKKIDSMIDISLSHVENKKDLNIKTRLNKQEYLYSKLLVNRYILKNSTSIQNFILKNKPEIGDKVVVKFFNNNPNHCIFENNIVLTFDETINLTDNNLTISNIEREPNNTNIKWSFVNNDKI